MKGECQLFDCADIGDLVSSRLQPLMICAPSLGRGCSSPFTILQKIQFGSEDILGEVVLNGREGVGLRNLGRDAFARVAGVCGMLQRDVRSKSMKCLRQVPMSKTAMSFKVNNDVELVRGGLGGCEGASPHSTWVDHNQSIIYYIIFLGVWEWDELSQNPFLAFYQRWPWLRPKYSILSIFGHYHLLFVFCNLLTLSERYREEEWLEESFCRPAESASSGSRGRQGIVAYVYRILLLVLSSYHTYLSCLFS